MLQQPIHQGTELCVAQQKIIMLTHRITTGAGDRGRYHSSVLIVRLPSSLGYLHLRASGKRKEKKKKCQCHPFFALTHHSSLRHTKKKRKKIPHPQNGRKGKC